MQQNYLVNPVFHARYIQPNIQWYISYFRGKRGIARLWREPLTWILKKYFFKAIFSKACVARNCGYSLCGDCFND